MAQWLEAVRSGRDVTVTDKGVPVARLTSPSEPTSLDDLIEAGIVTPATNPTKIDATKPDRPRVSISLSDIVIEQRNQ